MNKAFVYLALAVALILVLSSCAGATAQSTADAPVPDVTSGGDSADAPSEQDPSPGPPPDGLVAQLRADRDVYTLGEPVALSLTLRNTSSSPILIYDALDIAYGLIWLQAAAQDGDFRRYVGPGFSTKSAILPQVPLEPGEEVSVSFTALYHRVSGHPEELPAFYAFDSPGTCRLRAEFIGLVPDRQFVSDAIEIQFVEPQGVDEKVWKLLQTEEAAYFLHVGRPLAGPGIVDDFEEIASRYPGSIYVPAMRAAVRTYRALAPDADAEAPTANVAIIALTDGRALMARAQASVSDAERDVAVQAIADLVDGWVEAYNAQDFPRFVECFSPQNPMRKKWDQGPGDRDRTSVLERLQDAYASTGTLHLEIIGVTVGRDTATADVTVTFEQSTDTEPFPTMEFVLADSGVWQILEAGF